jgi:hypothetical protein
MRKLLSDPVRSTRPFYHRQTEINRLRSQLELNGWPRLQMFLIVSITGGAGFLAAYSLLQYGVTSMALRYPLALALAYLVFLFLLWLWLRTTASDYAEIPDIPSAFFSPRRSESVSCDDGIAASPNDGEAVSGALDAVGQADEFAIPLIVLLVLGGLLLSSLWVVYSAPVLFAELLIDGALSASLYRRLRGIESQHWLATAIRRTIWPFVLTALMLCAAGKAMQLYAPDAKSFGDVIRHAKR